MKKEGENSVLWVERQAKGREKIKMVKMCPKSFPPFQTREPLLEQNSNQGTVGLGNYGEKARNKKGVNKTKTLSLEEESRRTMSDHTSPKMVVRRRKKFEKNKQKKEGNAEGQKSQSTVATLH